jgi:hypothetical protein
MGWNTNKNYYSYGENDFEHVGEQQVGRTNHFGCILETPNIYWIYWAIDISTL